MRSRSILFISVLVFLLYPRISLGEDWSNCAYDLERLYKASRDASEAAQQAEDAREEFDDKKEELENCINYPELYDLFRDDCRSRRWDYESAKRDYESALDRLDSELSTVDSRVKSVSNSCNQTIHRTSSMKTMNKDQTFCDLYKSYKGKIPLKDLLEMCKKYMSESECKKCLGIK